jgi:hypothetical protein
MRFPGVTLACVVALAITAGCEKKPLPIEPTPDPTPTPAAAALSSVGVSVATVVGDGTATGTVSLTAAAPSGGAAVALSSSNVAVSVPASVTVAAGSSSQTFEVRTFAPSADRVVTITAAYAGVSRTADITVQRVPPPPAPAATILGKWAGTLGGSGCSGAPIPVEIDITPDGSGYAGACRHNLGIPGPLTSFRLVTTAADYQDFLGTCLSNSVDARFFPATDRISWIWRSDCIGTLTRR